MEDFVEECLEFAHQRALSVFRYRRDRDDIAERVVNVAWELAHLAPDSATAQGIAKFAVKRVASGREFQESVRSISHRRHYSRRTGGVPEAERERLEDNPAFITQVTLDFAEWWQTLNRTQQIVGRYFQQGYRTGEIAELLSLSAGRISQIRKELRDSWHEFLADE